MSFHMVFAARSRLHALRLLEERKTHVPLSVFAMIKAAIENVGPAEDAQQVIMIEATGHLALKDVGGGGSTANVKVTPIYIRD